MSIFRVFILFSFVLTHLNTNAQVPGYMGKKVSVAAGTEVSPLVSGLLIDKKVYSLLPKVIGSIQYVIGLDKELALHGSFSSGVTEVSEALNSKNMQPFYNNHWSAGLNYRTYQFDRTGSIAPLGTYRSYGIEYAQSRIIDKGIYLNNGNQLVGSWSSLLISAGTGKQLIFNDWFLIDYGVEFSLATNVVSHWYRDFNIPTDEDRYSRFDMKAMENLFFHYLITVYFEFGSLIY